MSSYQYFVTWATRPDLFYAFDVGLWRVGQWVAAHENGDPYYVSPEGERHKTLAFAWRNRPIPTAFDGRHIFPLDWGKTTTPEHYVVFDYQDFRTPMLLPEVFPTAKVKKKFVDAYGKVYAQVYTRPAGALPARPPRFLQMAQFGDGIGLQGYDVSPLPPQVGKSLYLQLHWMITAPPAYSWTVFTHVVDLTNHKVVAGTDHLPGHGSLPTDRWRAGWCLLDEYEIALPADLPSGRYGLRAGLYRQDGQAGEDHLPVDPAGVDLGTVEITN